MVVGLVKTWPICGRICVPSDHFYYAENDRLKHGMKIGVPHFFKLQLDVQPQNMVQLNAPELLTSIYLLEVWSW